MGIIREIIHDILGILHQAGGHAGGNCFRGGARIQTPGGEVEIEMLRAGDIVTLADGRTTPIKRIVRQTVEMTDGAWSRQSAPIRFEVGSIAPMSPMRSLEVSPDHSVFVDGYLVRAGDLVNGTTITQVSPDEASFEYFHIELDAHELIVAEGLAVESCRDPARDVAVAPVLGDFRRAARVTKTLRTVLGTPGTRKLAAVRNKIARAA